MLIRFLYMEVDKYDKKADCDDSFDGGIDDGSSVMISLDLNTYVIKDGKQYIYEYSQELQDLNKMIDEAETEP